MKNKKGKKNKKKILKTICFLISIILIGIYLFNLRIKNIYVEGNNILTDQEVIDISEISNYPSFLLTTRFEIKNNL